MHLSSIRSHISKLMLATLFVATASSMSSQVAPATKGGNSKLAVGGGFSNYDVNWGSTRKDGYTLWVDWTPPLVPHVLNGLQLELQGHDILWVQGDKPAGFREIVGSGGPMYEWHHFRNFRPFGKFLIGFGGISFGQNLNPPGFKPYTHDTRTVYAPGGGFEYRVHGNLWARAEYEYERWPALSGRNEFSPQGFTIGAMYDIKRGRRR